MQLGLPEWLDSPDRHQTLQKHLSGADNHPWTRMPTRRNRSRYQDAVSIAMASRITGVEVHTLRYWEAVFDEHLRPLRTPGGQRRYRPQDIQAVFAIKRLLKDDRYSIEGAKRFLNRKNHLAA